MKKILILLLFAFLFVGCSSPKDVIEVTAYEWKVTLENGDYATGVAQTQSEAKKKIKDFADGRKRTIKKDSVKPVKQKLKKKKF